MVVGDFDFVGIARLPAETDTILLIDADTVLSTARTDEALQPVPRGDRELAEIADAVELRHLPTEHRPQLRRTRGPCRPATDTVEEILAGDIGEASYHGMYYNGARLFSPVIESRGHITPEFCCKRVK